jgi:hypothetical protein
MRISCQHLAKRQICQAGILVLMLQMWFSQKFRLLTPIPLNHTSASTELKLVHVLTPHAFNVHLNIILPFMSSSPKWSFQIMFWTKSLHAIFNTLMPNHISSPLILYLLIAVGWEHSCLLRLYFNLIHHLRAHCKSEWKSYTFLVSISPYAFGLVMWSLSLQTNISHQSNPPSLQQCQ